MGQSINDRHRKFYSNVDDSIHAKERKKAAAIQRHREAKMIRHAAKRAAIFFNAAG